MIDFDKKTLITIAQLSGLSLSDAELAEFENNLSCILNYSQQIARAATDNSEEVAPQNVNVFREDKIMPTDTKTIMADAPKTHDTLFVVPKIIS